MRRSEIGVNTPISDPLREEAEVESVDLADFVKRMVPFYAQCLIEVGDFFVFVFNVGCLGFCCWIEGISLTFSNDIYFFLTSLFHHHHHLFVYIDHRFITEFRGREAQHPPTPPCLFHVGSQCHHDIYWSSRRCVYPCVVLCPAAR